MLAGIARLRPAALIGALLAAWAALVEAQPTSDLPTPSRADAIVQWNNAALQGIRDAKLGAPVVARALSIVHTCMFDTWAAYDERAVGTQLNGALRRPASERLLTNKEQAISYGAYRALVDVLPDRSIRS